MAELLLGVNIDHVATVRNAREPNIRIRYMLHFLLNKLVQMGSRFICAKIAAILLIVMFSYFARLYKPE